MIITLVKADFSANNIGTVDAWMVNRTLGVGASYEGVNSVAKGEPFTAIINLATGYTVADGGVVITMGGIPMGDAVTINGQTITITIAKVTGNILITALTKQGVVQEITDVSGYDLHLGFMSSTGAWNNINEKYKHIVIPITGAATLDITSQESTPLYMAGLRSYSEPVNGEMPDYSENEDWSTRIAVPKNTTRHYDIPSDVKYLVLFVVHNTADNYPVDIVISMEG